MLPIDEKLMLALQAGAAIRPTPVWSKTITTVIITAGKVVLKNKTYIGGIGGEVVGLS